MTGSPSVITALKMAQNLEAGLSLQYGLNASCLSDMGVKKLAKRVDKYSENSEEYLEKVTERVLFLDGDPSFTVADIKAQTSVTDLLQYSLNAEMAIVNLYESYIQTCVAARDDGTRNLFEHLIKWHQKNVDWLEEQLDLIAGLSEEVFIAQKI